jgi:hypothetical protein
MSFGDGGTQLVGLILRRLKLVGRRCHAAARHDLDRIGTLAQLGTHGAAYLVDTVGDIRHHPDLRAAVTARIILGPGPEVTMAAALAQRMAADEHSRSGDQAAIDRLLHALACASRACPELTKTHLPTPPRTAWLQGRYECILRGCCAGQR